MIRCFVFWMAAAAMSIILCQAPAAPSRQIAIASAPPARSPAQSPTLQQPQGAAALQGTEKRRRTLLLGSSSLLASLSSSASSSSPSSVARADALEDYKSETEAVIEAVKSTLGMDKEDPAKPQAVAALRSASNRWVAKYRREKGVAGRPSFSNMYSVLNAISGHYISFGPTSNIPAKRQQRILEEVGIAANALQRGR